MRFKDRIDAGKQLATLLEGYCNQNVVVFALPRGGAVVGAEIARRLKAPLDIIIARKIGHPHQPEYAIAAIAEDGHIVGNQIELQQVDPIWLEEEKKRQSIEAKRRRELYLQGRKETPVEGKIAILVDDGVATGLTMQLGIVELKHRHPKLIVVAVPVSPKSTADRLRSQAGELVAVEIPNDDHYRGAVGAYYDSFPQTTDSEVISLLKSFS